MGTNKHYGQGDDDMPAATTVRLLGSDSEPGGILLLDADGWVMGSRAMTADEARALARALLRDADMLDAEGR